MYLGALSQSDVKRWNCRGPGVGGGGKYALPPEVINAESLTSVRKALKTHLFDIAYSNQTHSPSLRFDFLSQHKNVL